MLGGGGRGVGKGRVGSSVYYFCDRGRICVLGSLWLCVVYYIRDGVDSLLVILFCDT